MRIFLISLAVLVALVASAIVFGPMLVPPEIYRTQITQAVEKATGRTFTIDGRIALKVFPSIKARVEHARLGNAPGGEAPHLAEVGELDVGLALWPLLSRRIEITGFALNDAVIHLETKGGKGNWEFESAAAAEAGEQPADEPDESIEELSLGDVRLGNALVTFADLDTGARYEIRDINAKIALPSLDQPLTIAGDLVYLAEKFDITATIDKPRAAMDGTLTPLALDVASKLINATFKGNGQIGDTMKLAGDTSLDVPSVRALAGWLGNPLSGEGGFGPLKVSGKMRLTERNFSFENANLTFDANHATGEIAANLKERPKITGNLSTDMLDLRPYVPESGKSAPASGDGVTASTGAAAAEWSDEPLDLSPIKAFDANLTFNAGQLLVRDLKIGKSQLAFLVHDGIMTANLREIALYSGSGKGRITINSNQAKPTVESRVTLSNLDLESFLRDAAKSERISGRGALRIDVDGAGLSQREIVSSLAGEARLNFKDGAIKGVDLVRIASAVDRLTGGGEQVSEAEGEAAAQEGQSDDSSTRFVSMGGNFAIQNGVASTSDFKMINDVVSLSGRGSINLVQQTIDFRVDPGRSQTDGGLKVALLITGPLAKPRIVPDLTGIIQSGIRDVLGEDNPAGQIIDQILGGGQSQQPGEGDEQPQPPPAQQLLDSIFGN